MMPTQTEYDTEKRKNRIMDYVMILLIIEMTLFLAVILWVILTFAGIV